MTLFALQQSPLTLEPLLQAVSAPEAGGIDVFFGVVRNHSEGKQVTLLEYESYESMAKKQMQRIADSIAKDIAGVRLAAVHRVGALHVGETAIICAASAPHRDEAFRACRLLIDRIKAEVPVWKREHGPDGPYWVGWHDARCTGHHGDAHHHSASEGPSSGEPPTAPPSTEHASSAQKSSGSQGPPGREPTR